MGLLEQDTTTFTFRHNPIPEKISFCRIEKISFLWKSLHAPSLFNSRTKTEKVLSNYQNDYIERF